MITNKQIAEQLEELALNLPDISLDCDEMSAVTLNEQITIKYKPNRHAVLAIAAKYRKGFTGKLYVKPRRLSIARKYNTNLFHEFVRDSEILNAITYSELHQNPYYFNFNGDLIVHCSLVKEREDFVVGRYYNSDGLSMWNVYHIDTGLACSSLSNSKKDSLKLFNDVSDDDMNKGVERNSDKTGNWLKWRVEYG